ncbi:MAG: hypothetical protein ACLQFR_05800 [Streptosporangiaceae bacterium]
MSLNSIVIVLAGSQPCPDYRARPGNSVALKLGIALAFRPHWADDIDTRHERRVTSLSWIPSEAVPGPTRAAFDAGFTHYDDPPPGELGDVEELRTADRFRFANLLRGWD